MVHISVSAECMNANTTHVVYCESHHRYTELLAPQCLFYLCLSIVLQQISNSKAIIFTKDIY